MNRRRTIDVTSTLYAGQVARVGLWLAVVVGLGALGGVQLAMELLS